MDDFEQIIAQLLKAQSEAQKTGNQKALLVRSIGTYAPPEVAERGAVLLGIKIQSGDAPLFFELPRQILHDFAASILQQGGIPQSGDQAGPRKH